MSSAYPIGQKPCAFFIMLIFTFLSPAVYAEYYIVKPGCGTGACYKYVRKGKRPCVRKVMRPMVVKRVYAKAPPCPCRGCDAMGSCGGPIDGWFPTAWETYNYMQFYTEPTFYITPNPDLQTGDDDAFHYPEMNIDR